MGAANVERILLPRLRQNSLQIYFHEFAYSSNMLWILCSSLDYEIQRIIGGKRWQVIKGLLYIFYLILSNKI